MNPRKELFAAIALCATGGAAVVIAAGRPWAHVTSVACADVTCRSALARASSANVAKTLGVAALAGVVAVLASRGPGRRLVGIAIALLGVIAAALSVRAYVDPPRPVGTFGVTSFTPLPARITAEATTWPLVSAAGAVALLLAGVLVAARGPRWQQLAPRYDGPRPRVPSGADSEAALWDAQSRGEDPT